jgi:outer membrane protein assembly factor BamB
MDQLSRRAALAAGGGLLASLVGCGERTDQRDPGGTDTTRPTTTSRTDTRTATTDQPTTDATPTTREHVAWTRSLTATSGLTVAGDTIYVGDVSGTVHAMGPGGSDRWTAEVGESYRTPVLLGVADGVLGVGLHNDMLEATGEATLGLDVTDGGETWRTATGDVSDGVAGSATIYAAEYVGELIAFDPTTGTERWTNPGDYPDPPVLIDGVALVGDDEITAVDPESGETRWTVGEDLDLAGCVGVGDRAYTRGEVVAAVSPDGTEHWRYESGGSIDVYAGDRLFGSDERHLFALSTDGTELWSVEKPIEHFNFDAATDSLVAGSTEGTVHVYEAASGRQAYTVSVDGRHASGMAATTDRVLVADENRLYALER